MAPETKAKIAEIAWEYGKALLQAGALAAVIILFIAQSHLVIGSSMEGTLHERDRLMVDKLSYRFIAPKRGEIIVFKAPANPRERYVKRIIGVPGDRIEFKDFTVYVNGVPLDEPYINGPTYPRGPGLNWPSVTVQPGHVYVLGDNRNHSLDSRYPAVGQVPYNLIIGRALFSYWPPKALRIFKIPAALADLSNRS